MENYHVLQQGKTQRTLIASEQPDPLVLRKAAERMRVKQDCLNNHLGQTSKYQTIDRRLGVNLIF